MEKSLLAKISTSAKSAKEERTKHEQARIGLRVCLERRDNLCTMMGQVDYSVGYR